MTAAREPAVLQDASLTDAREPAARRDGLMPGAREGAGLQDETAVLFDLLGRTRRALAQEDVAELGRLMPLLAGLGTAPVPAGDPARVRKALLGLLDEAGQLAGKLRQERTRLAAQLHAGGVHRRAGVAYRRAGKL